MKFIALDIPATGTWIRDCELYAFNRYPHLSLEFTKESDETAWKITFNDFIAFKVTSHEFMIHLLLLKELPDHGAFYLIENSPWLHELKGIEKPEILDTCKHYVLFFYEEVVEIISNNISCEKVK